MAYFGYPAAHEDDAERAVRAGLDLVTAVAKLDGKVKVEVRVGIATGLVVVGDLIGEQGAKERAVTGETPNLAARLQGLAPPGSTVVSVATRRLLGGQFDLRDLGAQQVKGLDAPVAAFAVTGVRSFESRFEARAGGLTGFVGREDECEHLLERWKLARQRRGQVVLISGEAGIGKSRLTAWLVDKVAGEPHTRMRYQCTPHHKDSALYPTIAQIERAAGIVRADPGEAKLAKLEALLVLAETEAPETVPLFAALLAIPTGDRYPPLAMSPSQQRQRTLAMLLDQVEALARRKPLLMIYEDAHWADATSLELLDSLVDRLARLPIHFVVTGRPEFSPAWAGRHNVSTVTLQKLDKRHTRAMVEGVTGGAALPADVLDQIVAKTDGVPLFVEELTKTVLESGALAEDGNTLKLTAMLPIPATLQDSLMARLDRSNPVKEIAQIGAAIGREFSYKLLLAAAGLDEATVRAGLAKLEAAELATHRGVPPDATYTFKHALVQDAAYESMLKSRRQAIHRRIAKALRDQFPILADTEPEIIAHHFAQAGRDEPAVEWWKKAGGLALHRCAYVEATAHFERAIAGADALPGMSSDNLDRVRLQIAYGEATLARYGYGSARVKEVFARARAMAGTIQDVAERCAIQYGLWVGCIVRGEIDAALEMAESLLADANQQTHPAEASVANRWMCLARLTTGNNTAGEMYGREAVRIYESIADQPPTYRYGMHTGVAALTNLAGCIYPQGKIDETWSCLSRALRIARESDHAPSLAYALLFYPMVISPQTSTDPATLLPLAEEMSNLARKYSMPYYLAHGEIAHGWCLWHAGDREVGEAMMRRAEALREQQGIANQMDAFSLKLADVEFRTSRFDAALSRIDVTRAAISLNGVLKSQSMLLRMRARILLRLSNFNAAEGAFLAAITVARRQSARTYQLWASLDLAHLYCDIGREREAVPLLQGALVGLTETPELPEIGEAQQLLQSIA